MEGAEARLADALRAAVDDAVRAGRFPTLYAVAKAAGVKPEVLYQFATGRDPRLSTAEKLAAALGLVLVPAAGKPVAKATKAKRRRAGG